MNKSLIVTIVALPLLMDCPALAQQLPMDIQLRFQLGAALQAEAKTEAQLIEDKHTAEKKADWWAAYVKGLKCKH